MQIRHFMAVPLFLRAHIPARYRPTKLAPLNWEISTIIVPVTCEAFGLLDIFRGKYHVSCWPSLALPLGRGEAAPAGGAHPPLRLPLPPSERVVAPSGSDAATAPESGARCSASLFALQSL